MHRIGLLIFSILGLVMVILPITAQDTSITDIMENSNDLNWLKIAFETAPDVLEIFEDGEPYTFFAPNDDAFIKLADSYTISVELLLSDETLIEEILKYHIIEGAFTSEQLGERSGQVVPTLLDLEGAFVSFRANESTITINNVVTITEPNIEAATSIVHIIDNVLRNRIIDDKIIEFVDNNAIATQAPPTAEPTPEVTETEVPFEVANIRFAHFAYDNPSLDIFLNDRLIHEDFAYPTLSDFSLVPADSFEVRLQIFDSESEEALLEPPTIEVTNGDFLTIVITASDDEWAIDIVQEDYSELDSDSRIVVYNALADTPEMDIAIGGDVVLDAIAFGDEAALDLDALTLDLSIFATGNSEDPIVEQSELEIAEGQYVFLAIVGTTDDASIIMTAVESDGLAVLRRGLEPIIEEVTETPEPPRAETVLDVLKADDRFSRFVEALDASNPSVFNRLASRNLTDITVLAPTNEAFDDLYFTVGDGRIAVGERRALGNQNLITQVMQYHIVEGELLTADLLAASGTSVITILQPVQAFVVSVNDDDEIFLNVSVQIIEFDIQASNGVIHIIEDVLLPQAALTAWGLN